MALRAVVTGASSGIGAAFVDALIARGDVLAVGRNASALQRVAHKHEGRVRAHVADLADANALRALEAIVSSSDSIDVLVNAAGFGQAGPFAQMAIERLDEMIAVNVLATTRLTRAVLPAMLQRKSGNVICVSSLLAFTAMPLQPVYSATKAYLNAFIENLAKQIAGTGVRLQSVCPGPVSTEFHARAGYSAAMIPPAMMMSADAVVRASIAALDAEETLCVPALEDPAVLEAAKGASHKVYEVGRGKSEASRYRKSD